MGQSGSSVTERIDGFQVVRVLPNSPAHRAGMLPYFDIITAVGHENLVEVLPDTFKSVIANHKEQKLVVTLYNLRVQAYRDVDLTPSSSWGGRGLLGCSIEWANARDCMTRCWHILDIAPDSPASQCVDVKAERDYIIGMQPPEEQVITMLRDQTDFENRLEMWRTLRRTAMLQRAHFGSSRHPTSELGESRTRSGETGAVDHEREYDFPDSLLFLVYDSEDNSIRELAVDMSSRKEKLDAEDYNDQMGVGFALGIGYLHMIPVKQDSELPLLKRFYVSESGAEQNHVEKAPTTSKPEEATAAAEAPHPQPAVGCEEETVQEEGKANLVHQTEPSVLEGEASQQLQETEHSHVSPPPPQQLGAPTVQSAAYAAFDRFPQFPDLKTTFPPVPTMSTVSSGTKSEVPPVSAPRLSSHAVRPVPIDTHSSPSAPQTSEPIASAPELPRAQPTPAKVDRQQAIDDHAWTGDRRPPPFVFPKMPPPLEFPRFPNQQ